ncbi:peptidylprolyl isomerase [Algiphilus sp.]|uniref:peptidylprolyl isomerase n=1 Tax=Algiphilus sp. TaxID=1872431 RepID=UPI003B5253F0
MTRLFRHPLAHFFAIGTALLVAAEAAQPLVRALDTPTVRVSTQDREQLRRQWLSETGAMPSAEEMRALVRLHIDEAILFEEALRLGIAEQDTVVRDRLLKNMRFVHADQRLDDAALLRQAQALGMLERDPVVRRRLVQRMQHRLESQAMVDAPALAASATQLQPERTSALFHFEHVFFSSDLRADPMRDARQALSGVQRSQPAPTQGDGFLLGPTVAGMRADALGQHFGPGFASGIAAAPVGVWHGPIASSFGAHLVRVTSAATRPEAAPPTLRQVLLHARQAAEKEALRSGMERLRARYRIVDDGDALEMAMQP